MARPMTHLIQFCLYLRLGLVPNQHLRFGQNHLERADGKIHGCASRLEQLHYPRFVYNPSVGVNRFPCKQRIQRIRNGSERFAFYVEDRPWNLSTTPRCPSRSIAAVDALAY